MFWNWYQVALDLHVINFIWMLHKSLLHLVVIAKFEQTPNLNLSMNKSYNVLVWRGMLLLFEILSSGWWNVSGKNDWMFRLWTPRIDMRPPKDQYIIVTLEIMEILSHIVAVLHRQGPFSETLIIIMYEMLSDCKGLVLILINTFASWLKQGNAI